MRDPPVTLAEVYMWQWGIENCIELVHLRVPNHMRLDVLSRHGKAQSVYDLFTNIWDVSEYFGADDSDSEDLFFEPNAGQEDFDLSFPTVDLQEEEAAHSAFFESRAALSIASEAPVTVLSGPELELLPAAGELDILQYIMLHYGFLPPIPVPSSDSSVPSTEWNDCLKTLGLQKSEHHSAVPGLTAAFVSFVKAIQNPEESLDCWDLSPGH